MNVRMNGEMVRKRLYELGDKTQAQIAEKLDRDEGTCRRILKGNRVRVKTAEKVCEILHLDPLEVIIFGSNLEELPTDADMQASYTNEQIGFFTKAAREASDAAFVSMRNTLKQYGAFNREEVSDVLTLLLVNYGLSVSKSFPPFGLLSIDNISHKANSTIYFHLLMKKP